ncbi:MAG: hypothetical protein JWR18_424 [Segetibacter sp.]|jgi:hypothetical protein|nr:hypothetical protein [Segetibacter sp.]
MLSYSVTYFINDDFLPYTIGVKSAAQLTNTKFKTFMKVHSSKKEKILIKIEKIEAISEEEIERRFGCNWILINS